MRLLLTWLQIHPIGSRPHDAAPPFRIQVGAAQAVGAENFEVNRRWDPDTDLDHAKLDAAMASDPPTSIAEFLELAASQLSTQLGQHVAVQEVRPAVPLEPDEPAADVAAK